MPDNGLIYLFSHFHYDPVWVEDQRTYTARAFELVTQYLEAARRDPSYKFLLSELDYLQPYWNAFPEQRALLRELVAQGRIEVNGGYCEPNETSIQGEALLRNLIYGRLFQQGVLGIAPRSYLPLDVFGHCPQLPQILRQVGFTACNFSKDIAGVEPLCRAFALDGSEVIQKHEHYYWNPQSWAELMEKLDPGGEFSAVQPEIPGLGIDQRFVGMDMQGPPLWLLGHGEELMAHTPELRVGLPEEYVNAVEERLASGAATLPVSSRDLAMYHPGITVSRIELKIANRLAENALFTAERFCTIAWLLGADYPHVALDKAWRLLMFGQHHDAITGTPCDISFLDLMANYREALDIAHQVNSDVLKSLANLADTAPQRGEALAALVVFNPLPWPRTDICRARLSFDPPVAGFALREAGRKDVACQLLSARPEGDGVAEAEIAFVAPDVPALGYTVYHVVADARLPQSGERREADRAVIENEYYTVTAAAQAGGGLISILDRQAKRQILDLSRGHPGNEIAALGEQADRRQPAWTVFTTGDEAFTKDAPARVWVERGPVIQRIIISGSATNCAARTQEIAVCAGVRRIDFVTELSQYRGEHQFFLATFPLAHAGAIPVFEERFGAVARRRSKGYLNYQTFQGQSLSGCALLPAQNWVELGNCLRVTARKAGSRAEAAFSVGYAAIITGASREAHGAGEQLMRILAARGVTASAFIGAEDFDADRLHTTFRFSLAIGEDNAHAARRLGDAPAEVRTQAEKAVLRSGYAFVLTLEPAGEDDKRIPALLILARDSEAATAALIEFEKDAADGVVALPAAANAVDEAPPAPDDYGIALINQGNLGASVESDGTAAIALMHTTTWPHKQWGEGKLAEFFVPEHKDHRFRYALYAHRGDWRRGETTRRAYEFNQPLIAVAAASAGGELPPRHSFLTIEPDNLYLSALKPAGHPLAMGAGAQGAQPSVILRLYEGHGQPARAQVSTPFAISEAWRCDALERREPASDQTDQARRSPQLRISGATLGFDVAPYKVETLELAVQRQALLAGARFGPAREPVVPCHMRYWEHNLGPAPMGNQPVTVTMRGAPPIGATTRFGLGIANGRTDMEVTGIVRLSVPPGWTITPSQVPYRIVAGAEHDYEVAVIIPPEASPGYIRAEVELDGQIYQEVLPVGGVMPPQASLRRDDGRIVITLRNPNADRIHGRVDLITPLETWGAAVGAFAFAEVQPAAQAFDLEPGRQCALAFDLVPAPEVTSGDRPLDVWAYARIACHGQVAYLRCPM